MKIGIGIGDIAGVPTDVDGLVAQARQAEADGFASGWFANIFGMDACVAAAVCGRETTRLELGTAVVPTYPRHPHAMAQLAMSAQAACQGRFTLGVGLSHQMVIENMFGMSWAKSYSHMREYLSVLGPLVRVVGVVLAGVLSRALGGTLWPTGWPYVAQLALALVIAELPQYWLHRWQHERDMRMTKDEVKREARDQDISPEIKSQMKRRQREMAVRRMMSASPA